MSNTEVREILRQLDAGLLDNVEAAWMLVDTIKDYGLDCTLVSVTPEEESR